MRHYASSASAPIVFEGRSPEARDGRHLDSREGLASPEAFFADAGKDRKIECCDAGEGATSKCVVANARKGRPRA